MGEGRWEGETSAESAESLKVLGGRLVFGRSRLVVFKTSRTGEGAARQSLLLTNSSRAT